MAPPITGEPVEPAQASAQPTDRRADRAEQRAERTAARRAARQAKAAERASAKESAKKPAKDPFVEAPRAPKAGGAERRRGLRSVAASLLGAAGLLCSVALALGALLLALGSTDNSVFETLSSICDALVGPLRDLFTFSGSEADKKEALAAWGAGSIGYLVASLVVQRYLAPRSDG